MATTRESDRILIGCAHDPVVIRSCDAKRCRRIAVGALALSAVGAGVTAWTGHEALLAIVILAVAFVAQLVVC
jgi:hypothetical protein